MPACVCVSLGAPGSLVLLPAWPTAQPNRAEYPGFRLDLGMHERAKCDVGLSGLP
jgi:hypothetical protein